jgi:hypothetical protein
VVALAVGIGATLAVTGGSTASTETASRGAAAPERTVTTDPAELTQAGFRELPAPPAELPEAPAGDAEAAVEGFLAAEAAGDFERSFTFLAAAEQEAVGNASRWTAVHADVLAPVTGYEVTDVAADGDDATVTSIVGFEPSLDEVVGLVPAQAEVLWAVTETDGEWGVSIETSNFAPIYAPDTEAAAAAEAWVAARQDCGREGEWGGTLLGVEGPARALCEAAGDPVVGDAAPLDQLEATPFVSAFGEDVLSWGRQVPVTAPVELRAVVAPIGTQWRVIGVLPPAPD